MRCDCEEGMQFLQKQSSFLQPVVFRVKASMSTHAYLY